MWKPPSHLLRRHARWPAAGHRQHRCPINLYSSLPNPAQNQNQLTAANPPCAVTPPLASTSLCVLHPWLWHRPHTCLHCLFGPPPCAQLPGTPTSVPPLPRKNHNTATTLVAEAGAVCQPCHLCELARPHSFLRGSVGCVQPCVRLFVSCQLFYTLLPHPHPTHPTTTPHTHSVHFRPPPRPTVPCRPHC